MPELETLTIKRFPGSVFEVEITSIGPRMSIGDMNTTNWFWPTLDDARRLHDWLGQLLSRSATDAR